MPQESWKSAEHITSVAHKTTVKQGFILSKEGMSGQQQDEAELRKPSGSTHTSGLSQEWLTEGMCGTSLRPRPQEHRPFVSS